MNAAHSPSTDGDEDVVRSFFALVPIPVVLSDLRTGTIVEVNSALCEATGYSRDELLGRSSLEIGLSSDQLRAQYVEALEKHGEVRAMELEIPIRNGQFRRVHMFARRIVHRNAPHLLATFLDVTDRAATAAGAVSQLDEIRKRVATTTHDVNNLLAAAAGHAELLQTTLAPEAPGYHDAHTIVRAVEMASELTRELLDIARTSQGSQEQVDLHFLIGEVVTTLAPTFSRGIELDVALHAAESRVVGARNRLRRVLLNLMVNARDAVGDAGRITIATSDLRVNDQSDLAVAAGDYLLVKVTDDGPGIPTADLDRVFEPFFTTKGDRGTGLGLRIVSEVIHDHGGDVRVTSPTGGGTTFELLLPTRAD